MQSNKDLEKEIKSNSNTVFMSKALDGLLSEDTVSYNNTIICSIKTENSLINFDLCSKETFDNFFILGFISKIDSILLLEKEDITNISLEFEKETLRSFAIDDYTFNLSWKQKNNSYLVDIFINKRGD